MGVSGARRLSDNYSYFPTFSGEMTSFSDIFYFRRKQARRAGNNIKWKIKNKNRIGFS